ncbi:MULTISPECIES: DNA-binding protein [unclassified Caballeronia]|uniref:DNA-binding protein n=1 Tax=unclassified Caballeronia TaxID=2646786 RepID=UPI00286440A6|nr:MULTISPECIES: DNA-binding protein [unclassified Caballeronia]MDR5738990.1 DNA-binding protein [Caballeronia sp. LZ016]MDR5807478.1 DNA-binding protein [Caballeronia sp. LZ019]
MDTQLRDTLRQELDAMRSTGARRQDLSHHACKRLFFDLGVRPSVTTVRDLTQTGSASDIPRDIESFWEMVRSTLRVRVEAGAIPEPLQQRAGELLAELFAEARRHADTALAADRAKVDASVLSAQAATRDAEVRCQAIEQAQRRAEMRAEAAAAQVASLEAELRASRARESHAQSDLRDLVTRLEGENRALSERIAREQADAARLRDRIDELQSELRHNTEHYAQQIKDAVKDAERRVKPMLVELDALRGMAATYQTKVREAGQKEFDFLQQLSAARTRADRLESQVREQSDEIDALTRERDAHRVRAGMSAEVGGLIASLAAEGRLTSAEIAALGTQVDAYIAAPADCPACESAEPELQRHEDEFELSCPHCERSSGAVASKLAAVQAFLRPTSARV